MVIEVASISSALIFVAVIFCASISVPTILSTISVSIVAFTICAVFINAVSTLIDVASRESTANFAIFFPSSEITIRASLASVVSESSIEDCSCSSFPSYFSAISVACGSLKPGFTNTIT